MSTRVCLMITITSLVLASHASGQIERNAGSGRSSGARPAGPLTEKWMAETPPLLEHVSNAPRSVSNADELANEAATSSRYASVAASDKSDSMPLPPRSKREKSKKTSAAESSSGSALLTVLGSLAVVLAVFFVFVWVTRSAAPKGMAPLSKEVVESLGRSPLLGRQQMQLIRIGNKLILLSVTSTGADTLTEITDPEEVDRLAGLCRQAQAGSISETFRQVLAQATTESATPRRALRQARRAGTTEAYRA